MITIEGSTNSESRQRPILLFEDKLGITTGYEGIWNSLLLKVGLAGTDVYRRNIYQRLGDKVSLLTRSGNRKSPGFNPDPSVKRVVQAWVDSQIDAVQPDLIICMDPAILWLFNPEWDQATLDNLRGGVYYLGRIPVVITLGISAWHNKKREKDIARLNDGFTDQEDWEEEFGGDETDSETTNVWIEPLSIPYGRFILTADLQKAKRVYGYVQAAKQKENRNG